MVHVFPETLHVLSYLCSILIRRGSGFLGSVGSLGGGVQVEMVEPVQPHKYYFYQTVRYMDLILGKLFVSLIGQSMSWDGLNKSILWGLHERPLRLLQDIILTIASRRGHPN